MILPAIKVYVLSDYVSGGVVVNSFVEAYFLRVKAVPYRALQFTVYTEHGAIYSHLPIEAIFHTPEKPNHILKNEELQPYSCLEGPVEVFKYSLLDNVECETKLGLNGSYWFTIDYHGDGLAFDPEQTKTHNIIALENGQLAALPNNYIVFSDNWFADRKDQTMFPYKRLNKKFFPGG